MGKELKTHMKVCWYREVPCPFSECNGAIALASVKEHLMAHQASWAYFRVDNCSVKLSLNANIFMNQMCGGWPPMVRV